MNGCSVQWITACYLSYLAGVFSLGGAILIGRAYFRWLERE